MLSIDFKYLSNISNAKIIIDCPTEENNEFQLNKNIQITNFQEYKLNEQKRCIMICKGFPDPLPNRYKMLTSYYDLSLIHLNLIKYLDDNIYKSFLLKVMIEIFF